MANRMRADLDDSGDSRLSASRKPWHPRSTKPHATSPEPRYSGESLLRPPFSKSRSGSTPPRLTASRRKPSSGGTTAPARMPRDEIAGVVEHFTSLVAVIRDADPADKAELYKGINLALTYQPTSRLEPEHHGVMVRVRGAS
jgi:hypothetical protein